MSDVALAVEDVWRTYRGPSGGGTVPVLKGVSLAVAVGESVAVLGPSGSGKSTLLRIMGGLDAPDRGCVRVGESELGLLREKDLARVRNREIGFVFQDHHLLPQCTALENVLVPTLAGQGGAERREAGERACSLLERAGLGERMRHFPGMLSGGECQRVAVVRALINQPRAILADEPTGSLDSVTAASVSDLLLELNRESGVALVMVTHAEDLAHKLHRVVRLSDGVLA